MERLPGAPAPGGDAGSPTATAELSPGVLWLAEEVAAPANSWLTRMDGRGSRGAGRTGESKGLWRAKAQIQDKATWCSAREAGWCLC